MLTNIGFDQHWPGDTIWWHRSLSTLHWPRLLADGTKPLLAPMLNYHQWGPVTFIWGWLHRRNLIHQSLKSLKSENYSSKILAKSPRANELNIDGLVQDCNISIANALEILQSCIKPSICFSDIVDWHFMISDSGWGAAHPAVRQADISTGPRLQSDWWVVWPLHDGHGILQGESGAHPARNLLLLHRLLRIHSRYL